MELIRQTNPEQIAFIGALTVGSDYNNRTMLKLTDLISYYFNGPLIKGPRGGVNLADEWLMYQPVCSSLLKQLSLPVHGVAVTAAVRAWSFLNVVYILVGPAVA